MAMPYTTVYLYHSLRLVSANAAYITYPGLLYQIILANT